jgi:hypothetical protein
MPHRPNATDNFDAQWVVGGGYCKTRMKRSQIKTDLHHMRRAVTEGPEKKITEQLKERKEAIKEDQRREMLPYKPKVADATREARRLVISQKHAGKPPSPQHPRSAVKLAEHDGGMSGEDAALALRQRLRQSFEQTTANRSYGTLFPPLLTPYCRPMAFLRGQERRSPSPRGVPTFNDGAQQQTSDVVRDSFSVVNHNEPRRAQPPTGPKAFLPTGSSATAYRHFTSYGLLARIQATEQNDLMHVSTKGPVVS